MKCPRCRVDMRRLTIKSIKVDRCPQCKGAWYDANEFRLLKDREEKGDYRWIDFDLWKDRDKFAAGEQENLGCPRDGQTMTTVRYGDSTIRFDACSRCRGIWLDGGEYGKTIEYLRKVVDTQTVGDYLQDVEEEFLEIFVGPEGPLSELADFLKVLYLLQLRFFVQHPNIAAVVGRTSRGIPGV